MSYFDDPSIAEYYRHQAHELMDEVAPSKKLHAISIEMNIVEPDTIQVIDIYGDVKVIPINEVGDFNEDQQRLIDISINSHLA